jgi:hypothetical protein
MATIDSNISQEAYEKHLEKKGNISNIRLRPENETFFDAMMSMDMNSTPEEREILDAIRNLG